MAIEHCLVRRFRDERLLRSGKWYQRCMTITVHHLEHSRSLRILWLLEELGVDYWIRSYARDPETMRAPPELAEVHALGRAPVVDVDGLVLAESGAILEHFVERENCLRPTDVEARTLYRFWLHYAEGSAMPPLLVQLIADRVKVAPVPFFLRPVVRAVAKKIEDSYSGPEIRRHLGFIERSLGERPYFCGEEFSAADIQMIYPVEGGLRRGALSMPNTKAWLGRIEARPAYKRAIERGGPAMPS